MNRTQEDKIIVGRYLEEIELRVSELRKSLHEIQNPVGEYDFELIKKIVQGCYDLNRRGQSIMLRLTGRSR